MGTAATSYDIVNYPSFARRESHPARIATTAALFGLDAPPIETARVLELGTAGGGNILPLAACYPKASFIGIDLSESQVRQGQEVISALGLTNIELRQQSILQCGKKMGAFDYILCHGVFSWVPKKVQDRILDLCGELSTENGLAFISYNTFPGWHMRGMLREMMRYHTAGFEEPQKKVEQCLALLQFLTAGRPESPDPYVDYLKLTLSELENAADYYIFHEYLEDENLPAYFHDLHKRAESHGLQYVGDAHFPMMALADFPPETRELLGHLADDRPRGEQYVDFLRNRRFRESIWCLKGREVVFPVPYSRIRDFYLSSPVKAQEGPSGETVFRDSKDGEVRVTDAYTIQALLGLSARSPGRVKFADLAQESWKNAGKSGEPPAEALDNLAHNLFALLEANLLEVDLYPAPFAAALPQKPKATPYARFESLRDPAVTSLRHQRVTLEGVSRKVLSLLDGTRDKEALGAELLRLAGKGELVLEGIEASGENPEALIARLVERVLRHLAQQAFVLCE